MKITLNEQDLKRLDELLSQRDMNLEVSQLWNSFLDDHYDALSTQAIAQLRKQEGLEENEAVEEAFFNYLSLDPNDPVIEEMREKTNFGNLTRLDELEFINQPFNQLPIDKAVLGPYQLTYNYFEPYELFTDEDTFGDDDHFAEKTHVAYFTKKVKYLLLTQKSEVWMSITPFEIHTMKEPIKEAHGKVLTFGLGLGYFAYEASNKEEVDEVTIIEKDSKVIQLFEKNLLPFFPHKEKLHIIKQDAFLYFERELQTMHYDTIFVDIYHTASDALPLYLRFKNGEEKFKYKNVSYWIESSILALLRRYVLTLIEEYFQGYTKENYLDVQSIEDEILLKLYLALENKTFKSYDEIHALLSNDGLKDLAKKTK